MSQAKQAARKKRRREATAEVKHLRNAIRRGVYPRYFLAKEKDGGNFLERKITKFMGTTIRKLTWRQVNTFQALMSLPEVKPNVSENQPQDPASPPQSA